MNSTAPVEEPQSQKEQNKNQQQGDVSVYRDNNMEEYANANQEVLLDMYPNMSNYAYNQTYSKWEQTGDSFARNINENPDS